MKRAFASLAIAIVVAAAAFAQAPATGVRGVVNGKVTVRNVEQGLAAAMQQVAAQHPNAWVAYSVPVIDGDHQMCCWATLEAVNTAGSGTCRLEGGNYSISGNMDGGGPAVTRDTFLIFYRFAAGQVEKVRTYSCDCTVDAGGAEVVVLSNVKPSESVQYLAALSAQGGDDEDKKSRTRVVDAIALHLDPSAEAVLEKLAAGPGPASQRGHAAFWLARTRGSSGLDKVLRLMQSEQDDHARKKFIFAISQSKQPRAMDELVRLAKNDASTRVRGEAIFWLAQQAGRKAVGTITDAIENDPDTDVKKKAVFALSQMPKDDGVPRLIEVARSHRNPAVRKQAFFWLGESRDPRALAFIEEVIKK